MSSLLPVSVDGAQFQAASDYTSSQVAAEYQNDLAAFVNIFNVGLDSSSSSSSSDAAQTLSDPSYAQQLKNALTGGTVTLNYGSTDAANPPTNVSVTGLLNVLQNGLNVVNDPVLGTGTQYMTTDMTTALDSLLRSLQVAGVNIQTNSSGGLSLQGNITTQEVENWRNLAASSTVIQKVLQQAQTASTTSTETLQSLVELVYVQTGNNVLSNNLNNLQTALSTTSDALNTLNTLQNLHNNVTPTQLASFSATYSKIFSGSPGASAFVKGANGNPGVDAAGKAYFQGIDPTVMGLITTSDETQFMSTRTQLISQIRTLSGLNDGVGSAGSLYTSLQTVLQDINAAFSAVGLTTSTAINTNTNSFKVGSAINLWILDSQETVHTNLNLPGYNSGEIEQHLTDAISSGQSLNNTQSTNVQNYLFIFEEYYQSASSVLQQLTQILQTIAQSIAR